MPHVTIEYTSNLEVDIHALMTDLIEVFVVEKIVEPHQVKDIKLRAYKNDVFSIGDLAKQAYISTRLVLLTGRSTEQKQSLGHHANTVITEYFKSTELDVQVCVEVSEIDQNFYFKTLAVPLDKG